MLPNLKRYKVINTGFAKQLEKFVLNNSKNLLKAIKFPSSVVVLEFVNGEYGLFDTGYASHLVTKTGALGKLYKGVVPFELAEKAFAVNQLKEMGIKVKDIKHIILSHYHADHISGLLDFPDAKIYSLESGLRQILEIPFYKQLPSALFKVLLPKAIDNSFVPLDAFKQEKSNCFQKSNFNSIPLNNDASLVAIPTPGHALGHISLFIPEQKHFFIGDAGWSRKGVLEKTYPSGVTALVHNNFKLYKNTFSELHRLSSFNKKVNLIPCHCELAISEAMSLNWVSV